MSDPEAVPSGVDRRVLESVNAGQLPLRGKAVVVAVSGGADSLCLLHVLHNITPGLGCTLHVAHLNHMLRGDEAEDDALFVRLQCEALGLPCTVECRNVETYRALHKCSLEEAARVLRYEFLAKVARTVGATTVATGHTRDDLVETVFLHMLRGTGTHGLRGLDMVASLPCQSPLEPEPLTVVRPLLDVSREETEEYCRGLGVIPRVDSSNASTAFLRNRVRAELLPLARELNPRFDDALVRLAQAAGDDDEFISEMARLLWRRIATASADEVRIDAGAFESAAPSLQHRLVVQAVRYLVGDVRDLSAKQVRSVQALASAGQRARVETVGGLVWRRTAHDLVVSEGGAARGHVRPGLPDGCVALEVPGETKVPGWDVKASTGDAASCADTGRFVACLNADRIGSQLCVRKRRQGDRFQPLGMEAEKKLQDFMVDEKVPLEMRDYVPLVCAGERIAWVVGWRVAEWCRVGPDTRTVLRLDFRPTS